jgi:hypothetical protein
MGLASEMKNLSEDLLASFKQRIRENEELVNDVQKTLDGFRKDHLEMAEVLNANAADLRKGLANGEKDRLHIFNGLLNSIHGTIGSIQKDVVEIQTSTFNMINDFTTDRAQMADGLNKSFAKDRSDMMQNGKSRMKEFNAMMKIINDDINSINNEVSLIFKNTNDMLGRFENEHLNMSADLKAELGKNLADRVECTRSLLDGFQKRLSEISKENLNMAKKLRKDLANGESVRHNDYNRIMKGIHVSIKGIQKEVKSIQKFTADILGDLSQNREQALEMWNKMQDKMTQIRKTGDIPQPKQAIREPEKKKAKKEIHTSPAKKMKAKVQPKAEPKPRAPKTMEEKVMNYINNHPDGVKISDMEEPLGETRMKLGFLAKNLLNEGKVQNRENIYFPLKIN